MGRGYTGHIAPAEWRWVTVISSMLVLIAIIPFLWVVLSGAAANQQQFIGVLHHPIIATANLSKVVQGARGEWLAQYVHTPEPHNGVLVDGIYLLLGQISRLTSIPNLILFHVARVGAGIFMYGALYYLASMIWMRVRTRRTFFILAVFGSGLGWILAPLTGYALYPDLIHAPIYPFYSTLVNVDMPLGIACLAILAASMIEVLRPGKPESPSVNNAGLTLFIFSLLLVMIYPQGLLPIWIAFNALLLLRIKTHPESRIYWQRWMLWFSVPALPLAVYYATIFVYNTVVGQIWMQENQINTPSILVLLGGLGLPLLFALPGIYRAVRRFESDGNQLMIVWLVAILGFIYIVPIIQINFVLGLMLPIAYFGARASEDFWFQYLKRRWRYQLLVAFIPVISLSHMYVLFLPITAIKDAPQPNTILDVDYAQAALWLLYQRPKQTDVILTAPQIGMWIPAWTGTRVVYSNPRSTLDAETKRQAVIDWYSATDRADCDALINGEYSVSGAYRVSHVIYGPVERQFGESACLDDLTPLVKFGEVMIYRTR